MEAVQNVDVQRSLSLLQSVHNGLALVFRYFVFFDVNVGQFRGVAFLEDLLQKANEPVLIYEVVSETQVLQL